MSKLTVTLIDPSQVDTPAAGTVTYFTDVNDGLYKYKDETGAITVVGGGGGDLPYSKLTFTYSDFQPNGTTIGEVPASSIPAGDHRMDWASLQTVAPGGIGAAQAAITAVFGVPSVQIPQGQFFLANPGEPFRAQLRLLGFGISIDDLTAGEWELYYRFLPVVVAP